MFKSLAAKITAVAVVAFASLGGLASAGALPRPVQHGVAQVANTVGLNLPDPEEQDDQSGDQSGPNDQSGDQGTSGDTNDQAGDTTDQSGDNNDQGGDNNEQGGQGDQGSSGGGDEGAGSQGGGQGND